MSKASSSIERHGARSRASRRASRKALHPTAVDAGDRYQGPVTGIVGGRGNFNMFVNNTLFSNPPKETTVFDILEPHITRDALHNSREREKEHASTCHPGTGTRIIKTIEEWFDGNGYPVCWLHGPAGTGKSTIAHTIAEHFQEKGQLAAAFFFARKKGAREEIDKLIPTLAYQIAERIPSAQDLMRQILQDNRTLLAQTIQRQFLKLIVELLDNVDLKNELLVVVDGLDECASRSGIVELIKLLGEILAIRQLPLRFLLTSRPERDIETTFRSHLMGSTALWLTLEDSKDDVRKYLRERLLQVRSDFNLVMQNEPMPWPSESILEELVQKSEGLFLHASTSVQYIGDGKAPPQEKLQKVLKVYDGVDPLYTQVITDARESENFDKVMGSLMHLRRPIPIRELSELCELDVSNIRTALDHCHSILAIPPRDDESIQLYHASLRDFLTSPERSGHIFRAPGIYHAILMTQCLKAMTKSLRRNDIPPRYASVAWHYHGASLLFQPEASGNMQTLLHGVLLEMKQIDVQWLKRWMSEALLWTGVPYLVIELPPSKGNPKAYRALYSKLAKIRLVLKDVSAITIWMNLVLTK